MVYIQHMNNTAAATTTQTADFAKGVAAGAASFVSRDADGNGPFPTEFAGNEAFGEGFNAGWDAVAEQAGR